MHCLACDALLSNEECRRKGVNTGEFVQLCDSCSIGLEEAIEMDEDALEFECECQAISNLVTTEKGEEESACCAKEC